jgi:putative membrane-bound dehydrogenase-like protein
MRNGKWHLNWLLGISLLGLGGSSLPPAHGQTKTDPPKGAEGPLSPEQEHKTFHLDAGLKLHLVASEPQVESPVAMAFDEDGRLFVVEMRDYPNGPPPGQPGEGRIRLLEDRDGDGHYETSSVFADRLLFANGLLPWKGGLIVTAAPHILYLKDTNGDGKADQREVLFEGFTAENPQLRVSHPNLGLDCFIYVANGLRGGKVQRSGKPNPQVIDISSKDFRFDLLTERHEAITGPGQFGNTFDDWGNRFVCDNRHQLRHIVFPDHYLKRNPFLALSKVVEDTSVLPDGMLNSGGKIYPLSKNWTTSNLHAGHFTAACGVYIYRGDLLPKEYHGNAFTCDPTGNLVHREILQQNGGTFQSKPAREGVEFLATPNDWSRPVFLTHGPEGAMYMVDMYRAVIEHPQFMPPELKNRPDLNLGKDRGRIWRIVPEGYQHKPARPKLSKASSTELVKLLAHPNAWWRVTAQRLLWERQDKSALPALKEMCASATEPLARLHSAWLLERFGALEEAQLLKLLADDNPRVRQQAVLMAEIRLPKSAALRDAIFHLAGDADSQVRFQVALTLGEVKGQEKLAPLAKIAVAGVDDYWTRSAVISAVPEQAGALLNVLLNTNPGFLVRSEARAEFLRELTGQVGARRDPEEVAAVFQAMEAMKIDESDYWELVTLDGLAEGLGRRGTQLSEFLKMVPAKNATWVRDAGLLLRQLSRIAADPKRNTVDRLRSVRLLAHLPFEEARPILLNLMTKDPDPTIRLGAVRSLSAHKHKDVATLLVESWSGFSPALRREATEALLRSPDRIQVLLNEVQAGRIMAADIDQARTRYLLNYKNAAISKQAAKLFQKNVAADRFQAIEKYQASLKLKGNSARGRIVFQKNCATCHRIGEVGVDVGPTISDTRTKTVEALLTDILNPNQAIDNNFVNYLVTTSSGKVLSGVITAETTSSITLKRAENQSDVILRQDIEEIVSSGVSLMPEGLEKNITIQEMADLLSFLKNWRYLDGSVPGFETDTGSANEK